MLSEAKLCASASTLKRTSLFPILPEPLAWVTLFSWRSRAGACMYSWPLLCLPRLCSKLIGEARVPVRGQMAAAELWTGPRTAARAPPWHVLTIKKTCLPHGHAASWPLCLRKDVTFLVREADGDDGFSDALRRDWREHTRT